VSGAAGYLHRRGVKPNALTLTGLVVNILGAFLYYRGAIFVAGLVVLFAGLFDMLDGAVARAGGSASRIGSFTDAVVDRYSDFIIFGGILAHFATAGDVTMTLLVLIILCGALLVSYVRARAELVIPRCDVGIMERTERIVLLGAGSLFGFFHVALWLLAILTHVTALHRIYYTYKTHRAAQD
jgi:phosphatidylglycerophosphate synthase